MTSNDDQPQFAARGYRPDMPNASIHVSGSNFGPVAQGYQAHAEQVNYGGRDDDRARLEQALETLAARIRDIGGDDADDALEDIDRLHGELSRRKPDRSRIAQLIERVTAVVAPVSALTELADHVKELIMLVLH